jgi:hypothetical protein
VTPSRKSTSPGVVTFDSCLEVTGPAIVSTPGRADYEVATNLTLRFPRGSAVWLKWEDSEAPEGAS